ncbi:efflux RND transporter periplasmic adaptor subunit [Candidatus Methylospira mobilis]|uniref:efflux RND transporter periplasmic adaptor subunit n=1 Tax=Candidatus Methylospira mobilis TaxID=1808979 RepID=UPI0028EC587F|nr:efflux RND transporter periplasmic adaptor subunit [Candidatus Methylospira mobilis]WNV03913.1 efflux RND transporter periplasmic adaptor subunit [Candidatus Methylospira mobilis]
MIRIFRIGIVTALVLASAACKKPNTYVPPPPPQVTISHPSVGPVTPFLEFTGNIQSIKTVELVARVEGYLEKVLFREGDIVKEGQLMFLLQQDTYEAKLQQAQAQLLADKAKLLHAETELTRYFGLLQQNAAPQTSVDQYRYERDATKAAIMADEANVTLAKLNLSYTRVTAPFTGRAGRRLKDPGNLVGAGEKTVLAEINQLDPIYAYFTISEQDLLHVRKEHENDGRERGRVPEIPVFMGLANEEGYPHKGALDFAGIRLDTTTGTLLLRATFNNSDFRIFPGSFARIKTPIDNPAAALLLPEDAISFDQQGPYVLLVDGNNIVQRRSVVTGSRSGKQIAITDGVSAEDWVIVNGLLSAIPGKPVTPVKQTAAETGSGNVPEIAGAGAAAQ